MTDTIPSTSQEMPLLTFNSLYSLLREEKKSNALQKLPEMFYEALKKFLEDKKQEIIKLKSNSEMDKLKKERYVLSNSKKIALDLMHIRYIKISSSAIKNEIFEDDDLVSQNILENEKDYFDKIKSITSIAKKVIN